MYSSCDFFTKFKDCILVTGWSMKCLRLVPIGRGIFAPFEGFKPWLGRLLGSALNCYEILVLTSTPWHSPTITNLMLIRCLAPDSADSQSFISTAIVKYNQNVQIFSILADIHTYIYTIFKILFCKYHEILDNLLSLETFGDKTITRNPFLKPQNL